MGLLSWIILGLIAGVLASLLVGGGGGIIIDIVLGIVGALVGGFLASAMSIGDVTGINIESIVIATIGAILVILVVRALSSRRAIV